MFWSPTISMLMSSLGGLVLWGLQDTAGRWVSGDYRSTVPSHWAMDELRMLLFKKKKRDPCVAYLNMHSIIYLIQQHLWTPLHNPPIATLFFLRKLFFSAGDTSNRPVFVPSSNIDLVFLCSFNFTNMSVVYTLLLVYTLLFKYQSVL